MADPIWQWNEIREALDLPPLPCENPVHGISIDSRTLRPHEAYVAIRGDRLDGHDFVEAAFDARAVCAIVREDYSPPADFNPGLAHFLIRVDNPLRAMEALARVARARFKGKVIAVTGSVGKTGTKEALRLALAPSGAVHASRKSHNNHWGVPLSLANLPRADAFGVFEIGMNHAGEITPLTHMVRPHIAIVTTVEPVHLGHFDSVEDIADAKAEIFVGLEPGGVAILNRDNPHFPRLAARAEQAGVRIVSFGEAQDASCRLVSLTPDADGSDAEVDLHGSRISYHVGSSGRHIVMNSLAVLAAAHEAGADVARAAEALAILTSSLGRGARLSLQTRGDPITLVDESYNANPASMRAAIAVLAASRPSSNGRKIAVLGDMLELGSASDQLHSDLAKPIDEADIDVVLACGPHMRALWDALPEKRRGAYADSAEALEPALLDAVRGGDVVMIKGSLGSRMGPLTEALRRRYAADPKALQD